MQTKENRSGRSDHHGKDGKGPQHDAGNLPCLWHQDDQVHQVGRRRSAISIVHFSFSTSDPLFQSEPHSARLRANPNPIFVAFGAAGLEIGSSNLKFHITLVDIDSLKPHEEVIDTLVKSLANKIQSQGIVRDPIMVDQKEHVILDGMHRFSSLKLLKCRFAPCCLVDYDNPRIKVGSWFRLFATEHAEPLARNLLTENKLPYVEERTGVGQDRLDPRIVIFSKDGNCYRLEKSYDPIELTKIAVKLERALSARGYRVNYLSENAAFQKLNSGNADLVIAIPVFTKQQIRNFGVQGLLLPHKVTRHVMPSRPLRLDVPLPLLMQQNDTQAEADLELRALLSSRRVERKPPGSVVDGRRYEEELLVFTA